MSSMLRNQPLHRIYVQQLAQWLLKLIAQRYLVRSVEASF